MRQGTVFRRCTKCRNHVPANMKICSEVVTARGKSKPGCGGTTFTWQFGVDVDGYGERKKLYGGGYATKREALAAMQTAQGAGVKPTNETLGTFLLGWLNNTKETVRSSTWTGYSVCVRLHIIPRLGATPLREITKTHIRALYQELRETGWAQRRKVQVFAGDTGQAACAYCNGPLEAQKRRAGPTRRFCDDTCSGGAKKRREHGLPERLPPELQGLSAKSVHNVHIVLRAALNRAVEDGLITTNPAAGRDMHKTPSSPRMKTWSREQLEMFLGSIATDHHYPIYLLAAHTGMRRSEMLGLTWKDIKFTAEIVSVQTQLGQDSDGEDNLMSPTKTTRGRRSIKLEPALGVMTVLREQRAAQEFERRSWGAGYQDNDLVFCRPDGSPHSPDSITSEFQRMARRVANLPVIRLHDLRHTHATLWLEGGGDMLVLSRRLGHASYRITADRYAHVTDPLQSDSLGRYSAYIRTGRDTGGTPESSGWVVEGGEDQGLSLVVLNTNQQK